MIDFVLYFLLWTFMLYWIHRLSHVIPIIKQIHFSHHKYINSNTPTWHWNNLFLYNDTPMSTLDLWLTEVIPTFLFSVATGQIWIIVFYYLWAALIQETIEHNRNFNVPLLTSGKWHLIHHGSPYNYGLLIPAWDILFRTYKKVK